MPFLENVTRGRGIPRERLDAVAEHYLHFGGVSPINGINRALITAIEAELADAASTLPVYFGNRNWEPYVEDTVAAMRDNGIRRAAVFTTSAWGGYSGCAQYSGGHCAGPARRGCRRAGAGQTAAVLRPSAVDRDVRRRHQRGGRTLPEQLRDDARLVFTAHSIPLRAASRCGPDLYERQVGYAAGLVAAAAGLPRVRPGVAVPFGSAAGALAGARRRGSPRGAGRAAAPER